ncbi:glutathione S-transferase family protein [Frateuria aurantia]
MIVVHHLENSRSQRVLWLLEELGVSYEVHRYSRDPATLEAPPELRRIHPLGKSPLLEDEGQIWAESGAIVEYLADRYGRGRLWPAEDGPQRQQLRYWLHYAEGSLMPLLLLRLVFDRVRKAPAPWLVRPVIRGVDDKVSRAFISPQLDLHLDYLESHLGRSTWFGGDSFSAADIQMSFPLEAAAARGGLESSRHPRLDAFLVAIHQRPAYQRALQRGGPYAYA